MRILEAINTIQVAKSIPISKRVIPAGFVIKSNQLPSAQVLTLHTRPFQNAIGFSLSFT